MKPPIPIERARQLREQHPGAVTSSSTAPTLTPRPTGLSRFIAELIELAISVHEQRYHGRRA